MKNTLYIFTVVSMFFSIANAEYQDIAPQPDRTEDITSTYQNMIVVQRKAKNKANHFLLQSYLGLEFSSGPQSIKSLNVGLGYAFSDSFELYINYAPTFFVQDNEIKKTVENLDLANGEKATLVSPKRSYAAGSELFWLPAYGKDSWGPNSIIRSDTFFKFSGGVIQYSGASGMYYGLGIGKTFFLGKFFNFRVAAGLAAQQTILNDQKSTTQSGIFEFGSVWYL